MLRNLRFLLLIALMNLNLCQPRQSTASNQTDFQTALKNGIPTVSYCALIDSPAKYNGRFVRVRATYKIVMEYASFFDPACPAKATAGSQSDAAWLEFDESARSSRTLAEPEVMATFQTLTNSQHQVDLVIIGKFYGPSPGVGYGHMGACSCKFLVERIEKAEPVRGK
jgi:hypothetical protein